MSQIVQPRKLKGFRDYHPGQAARRKGIIDRIWDLATRAGFQPIITPTLEYADTLVGSGGGDSDKEVYRFMDHGEREVALRFDLTVPFARYVAENQGSLILPFKKLQIGDVWRGEKPQKGRYREFCQADMDIIGSESMSADIEVLACMSQFFTEFPQLNFTTSIGHRQILSALIQKFLGDQSSESEAGILVILDKLAKIGEEKVVEALETQFGVVKEKAEALLQLIKPMDDTKKYLEQIRSALPSENLEALPAMERFVETIQILGQLDRKNVHFRPDLSLARGLGYYTGIIFETAIQGRQGFGSVAAGGRYNKLVSRFSKTPLAGVGGSIGVDRFLAALEEGIEENGLNQASACSVFVAIATDDAKAYAHLLADQLRSSGISCDIAVKDQKIGQQLRYADRQGYAYVVTLGTDEFLSKTYSLKHMASGQEAKGLSLEGLRERVLRTQIK